MGKTKFSRRANTMDGVSQRQEVRGRAISEIRMIELRAEVIVAKHVDDSMLQNRACSSVG